MNPVRAWNRFWFAPISARPLGLFRMVFGCIILLYLCALSVEFDFWYSGAGLLQGDEARIAAGPFRISPLQYVTAPWAPRLVLAATFAAAFGVLLGWRTRAMSVLLYLGMLSLYHRNVSSLGGPDMVPMLLCFYLMLCPSGAACSLDARRRARERGGAPAEAIIVPWGVRLLQIQMSLIYFHCAFLKSTGKAWYDGTAVHYMLFNREFGQFNFEWIAGHPLIVNAMTHGGLLIEFALAFWLWFRPTRRWVALSGLMLHGMIRPILNIPCFGESMCVTYLVFLDHDEAVALVRALSPRVWIARLHLRWPRLGFGSGDGRRLASVPMPRQLEFAFERVDGRLAGTRSSA